MGKPAVSPEQFSTFGDLLKYLRRREELTQRELAIQVGYSDTQISRIEKNHSVPDAATLAALFVPALHIEREAEWAARLLELARQARLGDLSEPNAADKLVTPNNLPASLTTFIGREKEQAEIIQLLSTHRLVTVTGSGGIGKTRISLMVGVQLSGEYANGVWLAELAPLSDPAFLAQTVASVFGLVTQSTTISHTELLINFLRAKTVLLILDNCEHLIDACASLADTLLKNCPQLKILTTGREVLGILGEIQYRLPTLGLPGVQQPLEKIREYESVRLFEERARLAQSDFELTMENASSVTQICSRLDGIPLAIELAAARLNIFSTAQIAARLKDRFDLLTGGSRTDQLRHQTLRASIDWSWNLISEPERTLLRRLTVFAGGWTLEAAESVCSTAGVESQEVPGLLTQLAAKSLVIANRQPGHERRFHLHETIRQYAYEKLIEADEEESIRSRQLNYFLRLSEQAENELRGPAQVEWLTRLEDELDNLRAVLDWADKNNVVEAGLYIFGRLRRFWYYDLLEGQRWAIKFIEKAESNAYPRARLKALWTQGRILNAMDQAVLARSVGEECLALSRACGDQYGEVDALILLGFLSGKTNVELLQQALVLSKTLGDIRRQADALLLLGWDVSDPEQALNYREEAVALYRQAEDWGSLIDGLDVLGWYLLSNGELETAQKLFDEALALNQLFKNRERQEWIYMSYGRIALMRGDFVQARTFLQEGITRGEASGDRLANNWIRACLGYVALREGNVTEARQIFFECAQNFRKNNNSIGVVFALEGMAGFCIATGKPEQAAQLIGWSDATRKEIVDQRPRIEQDDVDRDIAAIVAKIGASAFEIAYDSGQKMTLDEAISFALDKKN